MIRDLRIRNFKTFVDATVQLSQFTVILGSNAVGKSNMFDALRFLKSVGEGRTFRDAIEGHSATGPSVQTVAGIRGGSAGITTFGSSSKEFQINTTLELDGAIVRYWIRVNAETYRVVGEELKSSRHKGSYVFSTHPDGKPIQTDNDSPVIVARFFKESRGPKPRREFSPNEPILSQFSGRRAESRINEEVAEAVRGELATIRPLELRPEILSQYSPLGRFELGEHGENFAAVVWQLLRDVRIADARRRLRESSPRSQAEPSVHRRNNSMTPAGRLEAINAWLSQLTPKAITGIDTETAPTGEVIFALKEAPDSRVVSARLLSDGTLRFAALAFAVLASSGRATLALEEIENGINPTRLQLLCQMIEEATAESKSVQVLATTHSPAILNFLSDRSLGSAIVIGWDAENECSRPIKLLSLPRFRDVLSTTSLGDLQIEGWIQFAADA